MPTAMQYVELIRGASVDERLRLIQHMNNTLGLGFTRAVLDIAAQMDQQFHPERKRKRKAA